jgi:hypothetical protein
LNWCVFYNEPQITGINNAPLVTETAGKKFYAGFDEVRKYLQQLKQKGLPAEVFDGVDRYQRYLAGQQLLTAEWNIIKGINSGENNIESYFRQSATSRKLIENQFVKIVEDVEALNREGPNRDASLLLADTLIEIRGRLNEYLKLKGHMAEFEKIKACYTEFGRRNDELYQAFQAFERWREQGAALRNLLANQLNALESEKNETIKRLEYNTQSYQEGAQLKKLLEAGLVDYQKEQLIAEKSRQEELRTQLTELQTNLDQQYNRLLTLEAYAEFRTVKGRLAENRKRIAGLQDSGDVLTHNYHQAGGKFRFANEKRMAELRAAQEEAVKAKGELEARRRHLQRELLVLGKKEALGEAAVTDLSQKETALGAALNNLNSWFLDRSEMEAALAPQEFLPRAEAELSGYLAEDEAVKVKISLTEKRLHQLELETAQVEGELRTGVAQQKKENDWWRDYQREKAEFAKQAAGFGKNTISEYRESLELLLHKEGLNQLQKEIELGRLQQKKRLADEKGYYVPNEAILALTEQLSVKCEFVKTGIEWLHELEPEARASLLRKLPYLTFAVIVDRNAFAKLRNGRLNFEFASDYAIPIVNLESVRLPNNRAQDDLF